MFRVDPHSPILWLFPSPVVWMWGLDLLLYRRHASSDVLQIVYPEQRFKLVNMMTDHQTKINSYGLCTGWAFYPLSYENSDHGEQGHLTEFAHDRCPAYC